MRITLVRAVKSLFESGFLWKYSLSVATGILLEELLEVLTELTEDDELVTLLDELELLLEFTLLLELLEDLGWGSVD